MPWTERIARSFKLDGFRRNQMYAPFRDLLLSNRSPRTNSLFLLDQSKPFSGNQRHPLRSTSMNAFFVVHFADSNFYDFRVAGLHWRPT